MGKNSRSIVWKPTTDETSKKLAGSCEVTALKLSAGSGAAAVAIYDGVDSDDAIPNNLRWFLDASTTDNDAQSFDGIVFLKGVFAVCEQGINFNPVVCMAASDYTV